MVCTCPGMIGFSGNSTLASWGAIIGFIVMMSLDVGLGGETTSAEVRESGYLCGVANGFCR